MMAKPGEAVKRGSILCRIHAADKAQADWAKVRVQSAFEFSDEPPKLLPLIREVI